MIGYLRVKITNVQNVDYIFLSFVRSFCKQKKSNIYIDLNVVYFRIYFFFFHWILTLSFHMYDKENI
jgi:hypothetical protein